MTARSYLKALVGLSLLVLAATPSVLADTFYVYANYSIPVSYATGIEGFIDTNGRLGTPGAHYLFVTGGPSYCGDQTAYVYQVTTVGDPNRHPDNPEDPGPIAPRTFTRRDDLTYFLGNFCNGHDNEYYVDDGGIYYGGTSGFGGIYHWDWGWANKTLAAPAAPSGTQAMGFDAIAGYWWAGISNRQLYRWRSGMASWQYMFTHNNLAGSHHDGLEVVNGILYVSDMTTARINSYHLDTDGDPIEPPTTPYQDIIYASTNVVEGFGYGANNHFWISTYGGHSMMELGGGSLIVPTPTPSPTAGVVPATTSTGAIVLIMLLSVSLITFGVNKIRH